ncbi:hypothetical protein YC2023_026769 [Brassica napus]
MARMWLFKFSTMVLYTIANGQDVVVQDDLKNAKSIVNWVLDYVTGPQFDFDPVKYEYCKQSPRQLYFSMKDGMTHLHR